jgi:CRISPR system Cascade subunit CasB
MRMLELRESEALQTRPTPPSAADNPVGRLAGVIDRADPGARAALARLNPEAMRPHQIAALSLALIKAGLSPETWNPSTWKRWALIAHGMALAGHDGKGNIGNQLATAGVAEARVTKLLVSRGDAFLQMLPRLLRLLVSKQVKPNWYELSKLIQRNDAKEPLLQEEAEDLRLRIAGDYFGTIARSK